MIISVVAVVILGTLAVLGIASTGPQNYHSDPVLSRIERSSGNRVIGRKADVGYVSRIDRATDLGPITMETLEDHASHWGDLGITPNDNLDGDIYRLDRDNATLKRMMHRWEAYWPEVQRRLKIRFAPRSIYKPSAAHRDVDSTEIGGIPIIFSPQFFDIASKDMVLKDLIPRSPVDNKRVDWDTLTTRQAAVFSTDGGPDIASQDDNPDEQNVNIKLMYGRVTLTGLASRVSQGAKRVNLMTQRVQSRIRAMMELLEQTTLTGDGSGGSFEGFKNIWDTNTVDLTASVIELKDISTLQNKTWKNGGGPDFGIAPHDVVTKLAELQESSGEQNVSPTMEGMSGFQNVRHRVFHNGMPIWGSRFLPDTAGDMDLFIGQSSDLLYPTLLDFTIMPLGAEANDTESWLIKLFIALQDLSANDTVNNDGTGGQHHGQINNIAVV